MREKENLEVGKTGLIICLVLLIAAILIPLINNFLKGNIKILNNDMRIDYIVDDDIINLNVDSQNANNFKCYYGLKESNMIEIEMSNNICTIPLKNLLIGQKYYYKIVAYKNDDRLFEKLFSKDYDVTLDYILKNKCVDLGYCNDKDIVYLKDDYTLYALYKKDIENKAVIGIAINNFKSYNLTNEDLTNFEPNKISSSLESMLSESSLNKYLINYQFEHDILEKGKLIDEKFLESKLSLLSWFDYENIKNYDYFKYVTTLLGSYQIKKRNNLEYHYPIYIKGKESRVLKNIQNETVTLSLVIALSSDLKVKGFGTIDEPFFLV